MKDINLRKKLQIQSISIKNYLFQGSDLIHRLRMGLMQINLIYRKIQMPILVLVIIMFYINTDMAQMNDPLRNPFAAFEAL
jgi:hypothetical protein